eukprot:17789-Heterococcus_DN1.PRE.1
MSDLHCIRARLACLRSDEQLHCAKRTTQGLALEVCCTPQCTAAVAARAVAFVSVSALHRHLSVCSQHSILPAAAKAAATVAAAAAAAAAAATVATAATGAVRLH